MLRKTMFQKVTAATLAAAMMFTVWAPGGAAFAETVPDPAATPESATPETAPAPSPEPAEAPAPLAADDVQTYTELPGDPTQGKYAEHIIPGLSPNGTTIDLFDYWLTGQTDADNADPNNVPDSGINKGHALLFRKSGSPKYGKWNDWTRSAKPYSGLVQAELGKDGYPALNLTAEQLKGTDMAGCDPNESLAYLFDPNIAVENGKASYPDVQGLLKVAEDGYYYYRSSDNYAVFYPEDNSFYLYKYPGFLAGSNNASNGQFFPFNAVQDFNADKGLLNPYNPKTSSIPNHYFGVHMSTRFIQRYGGHTDEKRENAVTYEFSGDDDVWIFIDGKLVADLGGIHSAASVEIDFSTGEIIINRDKVDANDNDRPLVEYTSLKDELGLAGDTFPDNTYHTLDFFYLERGHGDSNMQLKYNLVTIPESTLRKVDQYSRPVPGAEFALYSARAYEQQGDNAAPITTGTTNRNGEFVFTREENGEIFPITIDELYQDYGGEGHQDSHGNNLVLVETGTPTGYRSAQAIGLYFVKAQKNPSEVFLLSKDPWGTGTYAIPQLFATTREKIKLVRKSDTDTFPDEITLVGQTPEIDPRMFAVIFQKQKDGETWLPISGDPITGWHVQPDDSWGSIKTAALENRYEFYLSSSGAYQVEVDDLPGNIENYYHICGDPATAEYTFVYYYTQDESLDAATEENTRRIDADDTLWALDRDFSVNLYVGNLKNQLFVQKQDDLGNPLAGVEFTLWGKADSPTALADAAAVPPDFTEFQKVTTDAHGAARFENLPIGEYYLTETAGLEGQGYKRNDTPVHVIVDHTGVYADAGTADDGIAVSLGVGRLVGSMIQFAADDTVDTTLLNIRAALADNVQYDSASGGFTYEAPAVDWDEVNNSVIHLNYNDAAQPTDISNYHPIDHSADTLSTDTGWSRLLIRQCNNAKHHGSFGWAHYEDLGDTDLTGLFSGTVTVQVTNQRVGGLTVAKRLEGDHVEYDREWNFTVTLTDAQGRSAGLTGEYGGMTFADGVAEFTLTDGKELTATGLPADLHYEVTETEANEDGYTTAVTEGEKTGTIPHNHNAQVTFTNTRNIERGSLTVSKTVEGDLGDKAKDWHFTVTLMGDNGASAGLTGPYGDMMFEDGVAEFTLAHGEELTAGGLPAGFTYTVTEAEANEDGYTTAVAGDNATGAIQADGTVTVAFLNTRNAPEPTPTPTPGPTPTPSPEGPGDPGSPNEPAPSGQPTAPAQDPGTDAAEPTAAAPASAVPQTSDDSPIELWALLCVVSLGGLLTAFALKRIRRGDETRH